MKPGPKDVLVGKHKPNSKMVGSRGPRSDNIPTATDCWFCLHV